MRELAVRCANGRPTADQSQRKREQRTKNEGKIAKKKRKMIKSQGVTEIDKAKLFMKADKLLS